MSLLASKYETTVEEAVARLLGRADNSRGLTASDVRERVMISLEKYIFRQNAHPDAVEIRSFIDELRADDLCLVLACEKGDETAWTNLVDNFDQTVKSAARKVSGNVEDADDLASSIWAELFGLRQDAEGKKKSKLGYYSGKGSLAGWLRAVVAQLAVDQFRKQSKYVQIEESREFENLAEESSNHASNDLVVHHTENPESLLTEKQTVSDVSEALNAAIAGLEAEDKLILKLYYFDDLKLKDIASTFGYHEATASRKLARIQTEVRKSVEKSLKDRHGWKENEVKGYLSQTAATIGVDLEKLFTLLLVLGLMQDFWR